MLIVAAAAVFSCTVRAQDVDADAAADAAADAPADADAAAPPAAAAPKAAAKPADDAPADGEPAAPAAAEPAIPPEDEPAVQAVLESEPKTAAELVRAVDILTRLGHGKLAEPYVKQLVAMKLDPAGMAALADRYGSATLMRLAASPEISAEGRTFFDRVVAGAEQHRSNPQRLAKLVARLSDPNKEVRQEAVIDLTLAHEAAVGPLVAVLADARRDREHPAAHAMLLRLGEEAIPPLSGVMETRDARLKATAIEILGQLGAESVVSPLVVLMFTDESPEVRAASRGALAKIVGQLPSRPEAQTLLAREVRKFLDRANLPEDEFLPNAVVWHWDDARAALVPLLEPRKNASLTTAVVLARGLYRLDPDDAANLRLYLKLAFEEASHDDARQRRATGHAELLKSLGEKLDPDVVEDVLIDAMATSFSGGAAVAAEMLARQGSSVLLTRSGAAQSPLVQALAQPDRRLRFAEMETILKLHPRKPFAGSNQVAEALAFFASSSGVRRAVVGHPRGQMGAEVAGMLDELGYEPELATNGRDFFQLATTSPDVELLVVHMSIDRPPIDELLMQIRRDRRTARTPVLILATGETLERAHDLAGAAGRARAAPRPLVLRSLKFQVDLLIPPKEADLTAHRQRLDQARRALSWLEELSNERSSVISLDRVEPAVLDAFNVDALAVRSALVLANLGTATGQKALVDAASRFSRPLPVRRAAAVAFARGVERHGILLTSVDILKQYDRYNDSEAHPAETREVLAALLDTIEGKPTKLSPAGAAAPAEPQQGADARRNST